MGYVLDRSGSWCGGAVMRDDAGDKIIIARDTNNRWVYYSVRNAADSGSIIDFIQNRRGVNLGYIRAALQSWTGSLVPASVSRPLEYARDVVPTKKDRGRVMAAYAGMPPAGAHPYLAGPTKIRPLC